MACFGTKFEVAPTYDLGGDIFTRNVMDGRTHRRTDRQMDDGQTLVRNLYTLFLKKGADIIRVKCFRAS